MSRERKPTLAEYPELWLSRLMRHLPVVWVSAIGAWFGARYGRRGIAAGRKWVKRLHSNIERFSGVVDPAERERRIVEYTRRIGRIYAEFTVLQRLVEAGRVEVVGTEHLYGLSRPMIFVSGHLANWELVVHALTLVDADSCALYAPPDNPIRHRLAVEARLRWRHDLVLVPASPNAMRQITRAIARGRNLLMYVDEEKDGYIRAPGLGREIAYAGNRWLTARLAANYNADVVPVHVEAIGPARYRVVIEPRLAPGEGDAETRARALADQMERCLDTWVRANPEHWYWLPWFEQDKPAAGSDAATRRQAQ